MAKFLVQVVGHLWVIFALIKAQTYGISVGIHCFQALGTKGDSRSFWHLPCRIQGLEDTGLRTQVEFQSWASDVSSIRGTCRGPVADPHNSLKIPIHASGCPHPQLRDPHVVITFPAVVPPHPAQPSMAPCWEDFLLEAPECTNHIPLGYNGAILGGLSVPGGLSFAGVEGLMMWGRGLILIEPNLVQFHSPLL